MPLQYTLSILYIHVHVIIWKYYVTGRVQLMKLINLLHNDWSVYHHNKHVVYKHHDMTQLLKQYMISWIRHNRMKIFTRSVVVRL